jgi:excisionase family DNA binding protein
MTRNKNAAFSLQTMSVAETAKYMGVGRQIVYQLIDFGELLAFRENGAIRVDKASVDDYRNSGKPT